MLGHKRRTSWPVGGYTIFMVSVVWESNLTTLEHAVEAISPGIIALKRHDNDTYYQTFDGAGRKLRLVCAAGLIDFAHTSLAPYEGCRNDLVNGSEMVVAVLCGQMIELEK